MNQERPITIPKTVVAGEPISARTFNQMRDAIDRMARNAKPSRNFVPFGEADPGLVIVPGSTNEKWRITDGTVNGVTPTLNGTAIDATEPPEITVTENTYVWLKCVGTFGSPDSYVVTVETSSTADTPAGTDISDTGFVAFYYIGSILQNVETGAYEETNDHAGGNLGVDSWGLYNLWFKV